jgi:penicillin-binding protein 1C
VFPTELHSVMIGHYEWSSKCPLVAQDPKQPVIGFVLFGLFAYNQAMSRYWFLGGLLCCGLWMTVLVLDHFFPLQLERVHDHSVVVLDKQKNLLRGFTSRDGAWRLPIQLDVVDNRYLTLLKAYEDQRFDWHPGVDPFAILRAIGQWLREGRVVSGASTLTMQTVRLLEPRPRTLRSKLMEICRALQLEWHYDKDAILTMYLTLAPFGGNLEGLRAGSLAWLNKEPNHLTVAEAALLVSLPQAPSRLRPDRFATRARLARNKVLTRMAQLGVLPSRQVAEAHQEKIPTVRHGLPFHAPHLARRLNRAKPLRNKHATFIDGDLQYMLEVLARQQVLRQHESLAMLVVENASRQVIAYVGSVDFFATQQAGQVDMVQAVRSPGSTLKPLVYGIGFEDRIIHPDTLIADVPTRFGDYSPSNFRHSYKGQMTVREALQSSQNVPAVALLNRIGPVQVAARLRDNGIHLYWSDSQSQPGLPLVLGGVGTTLEDLVTLYVAFANGGKIAPLRLSRVSEQSSPQPLLSPSATWYLTRILEKTPPPDAHVSQNNLRRPHPIAYKTGTSYGFRDAWALGYDRHYTVGVWVGRPNGSASADRSGRAVAAPLLFRVFALLPSSTPLSAPIPPKDVILSGGVLPASLRYFSLQPDQQSANLPAKLLVSFPITGTRVVLSKQGYRFKDLPLVAEGGKRPLRWLINGTPIPSSRLRRQTAWTPDGEGFVRITVIDASGQVASANIWIETENQDKLFTAPTTAVSRKADHGQVVPYRKDEME